MNKGVGKKVKGVRQKGLGGGTQGVRYRTEGGTQEAKGRDRRGQGVKHKGPWWRVSGYAP